MSSELTPQMRANKKQNEARKGTPTFSAVRFKDEAAKAKIDRIISEYSGTREEALIAAFDALEGKLNKKR